MIIKLYWRIPTPYVESDAVPILEIDTICTPNWGAVVEYMEVITIKEFLDVGLLEVKDYIEMKKNMKNFNL